jgi:hypothetical protein
MEDTDSMSSAFPPEATPIALHSIDYMYVLYSHPSIVMSTDENINRDGTMAMVNSQTTTCNDEVGT